MKKTDKLDFPASLYVYIETDGSAKPWLMAFESLEDCESGTKPVAIYKLVEVGKIETTVKFVETHEI